ncbi:unnamed protein product [Protopolystoma xenopodis]|uniref:Uncharacterized protein n=1 Tax=Protopolystoma xenopodis TaxID=117903 RepID=A0A3S5CIC3_9PLAT|nr:unnamed protein product [Protopolystoma xenopodis]
MFQPHGIALAPRWLLASSRSHANRSPLDRDSPLSTVDRPNRQFGRLGRRAVSAQPIVAPDAENDKTTQPANYRPPLSHRLFQLTRRPSALLEALSKRSSVPADPLKSMRRKRHRHQNATRHDDRPRHSRKCGTIKDRHLLVPACEKCLAPNKVSSSFSIIYFTTWDYVN